MYLLCIKMLGVLGAAGVPAVIPVEDTSPGPGSVRRVTVSRVTLAVLESAQRLRLVITLTKVVIRKLT